MYTHKKRTELFAVYTYKSFFFGPIHQEEEKKMPKRPTGPLDHRWNTHGKPADRDTVKKVIGKETRLELHDNQGFFQPYYVGRVVKVNRNGTVSYELRGDTQRSEYRIAHVAIEYGFPILLDPDTLTSAYQLRLRYTLTAGYTQGPSVMLNRIQYNSDLFLAMNRFMGKFYRTSRGKLFRVHDIIYETWSVQGEMRLTNDIVDKHASVGTFGFVPPDLSPQIIEPEIDGPLPYICQQDTSHERAIVFVLEKHGIPPDMMWLIIQLLRRKRSWY